MRSVVVGVKVANIELLFFAIGAEIEIRAGRAMVSANSTLVDPRVTTASRCSSPSSHDFLTAHITKGPAM